MTRCRRVGEVDATTATFTVELVGATCAEVTPVAPTVDQAECVDGGCDGADADVFGDDGISLQRRPRRRPYAPGDVRWW